MCGGEKNASLGAFANGVCIAEPEAALIKGMLLRGDDLGDVAAYFGIDDARVREINFGESFNRIVPAPTHSLPTAGPYATPYELSLARGALESARRNLDTFERLIFRP